MRKHVAIGLGIVTLLLILVGGAFLWDCARIDRGLRQDVELADVELKKHERRLINAVAAVSKPPSEWAEALSGYEAAADRAARHEAYRSLEASAQLLLAEKLDPTNPLSRRVMDEVAGAINRRARAMPPYDAAQQAYEAWRNTWRGGIASQFSTS